MYSVIIFFITLAQLLTVFISYALKAQTLFSIATVYGSPIYLVMNFLNSNSAWIDKNPLYIMIFAYHIIKYVIFFKARLSEGGSMTLTAAIVFEAAYLCISGYYVI